MSAEYSEALNYLNLLGDINEVLIIGRFGYSREWDYGHALAVMPMVDNRVFLSILLLFYILMKLKVQIPMLFCFYE